MLLVPDGARFKKKLMHGLFLTHIKNTNQYNKLDSLESGIVALYVDT